MRCEGDEEDKREGEKHDTEEMHVKQRFSRRLGEFGFISGTIRTHHRRPQHGRTNTPSQSLPALSLHHARQRMDAIPIVMLRANRQDGRVGLHSRLDQVERVAERRANDARPGTGSDGRPKDLIARLRPGQTIQVASNRFVEACVRAAEEGWQASAPMTRVGPLP